MYNDVCKRYYINSHVYIRIITHIYIHSYKERCIYIYYILIVKFIIKLVHYYLIEAVYMYYICCIYIQVYIYTRIYIYIYINTMYARVLLHKSQCYTTTRLFGLLLKSGGYAIAYYVTASTSPNTPRDTCA